MPEADTIKPTKEKNNYEHIPMPTPGFFLKGASALDWGMKNRLARIFNPATGRTVMRAIDHGYFQGPTTGLAFRWMVACRTPRRVAPCAIGL